jgi:diacylglycerol kinase family enzyme
VTVLGPAEEIAVTSPFCLVVNPAAGGGRSLAVLPLAAAGLAAAGAAYQVSESASLEHARELAARGASRGEVVVAVGGDGLAGALAGVVAAAGGTYGIIPAGRGNDLARVLGIPADPAAAALVLTGGQVRQVDLIGVSVAGQSESMAAGSVYVGIPSVAGEIANATRWLAGPAVYPVAALRALAGWKPASFRVEICGSGAPARGSGGPVGPAAHAPAVHVFAGYAVVVANSAYFGAGMQVAPPALIDDGMLDIVLMRHGPKLAFVRALAKIKDGSHIWLPQVSLERGTQVTLTVDRDLPCAADGETLPCAAPLAAGAGLRIRVLPSVLSVLAPVRAEAGPASG